MYGTPICEYWPEKISNGRLAILGDAAHVVSPMTGRGFVTGVGEAAEIALQLSRARLDSDSDYIGALAQYEKRLLTEARSLVRASKNASAHYMSIIKDQLFYGKK